MKNFKAFIFDLDGTLVDTTDYILRGFNYALEDHQIKITWDDIERIRDRKPQQLFDDYISCPKDKEVVWNKFVEYSDIFGHQVKEYSHVESLIKKIVEAGYKIAIWTGRDQYSSREILIHTGLSKYFEFIIGSTDVKINKPHPEGLKILANKLNINTEEMVVIGDHEHDIEGATKVGAFPIRAAWGRFANKPFNNFPPKLTVTSIDDLTKWIEEQQIRGEK